MTQQEQGQEQEQRYNRALNRAPQADSHHIGHLLVALCAAFLYVEPLYEMLTRDVEATSDTGTNGRDLGILHDCRRYSSCGDDACCRISGMAIRCTRLEYH